MPEFGKVVLLGVTFHEHWHKLELLMRHESVPSRTIMEMLGHSQITLTLGARGHSTPVMFDEAAGALERALGGAR